MPSQEIKVLFYTGPGRLFATTGIGDLYEIAQKFSVILISEPLDPDTEKALRDTKLFPGLEKIIPFTQYPTPRRNIFAQNKYVSAFAKEVVGQYKPDVVITENDIYPFEMYLIRFGKRQGAITIARQLSLKSSGKEAKKYFNLIDASELPSYLPLSLRKVLASIYRWLGHIVIYWLLPLTVRELPFTGRTSYITWNYTVGQRVDYYAVLTEKDYNLFLKEGIPAKKLYVLPHPLTRETKQLFKRIYFSNIKTKPKTILINWPPFSIAFKASDLTLISKYKFSKSRLKIVELLVEHLPGWKITIKPHINAAAEIAAVRAKLISLSPNITIADPTENTNLYLIRSPLVVAPPPVSTALFIAKLLDPQKIVLSLNLQHELRGDLYKDHPAGVEYIDSEERFIKTLQLIKKENFKQVSKPTYEKNIDTAAFLESILRDS